MIRKWYNESVGQMRLPNDKIESLHSLLICFIPLLRDIVAIN